MLDTPLHPGADAGLAPPRILVTDDDPVQRTLMAAVLRAAGFEVATAADGAEAVAMATACAPDVLVVDAMMPRMNGFEVVAAVRNVPALATMPTLVVSGLEDVQSRVEALAVGADDFIVKPVAPAELVARIEAQLRLADAWTGRVNSMVTSYRSIRRRITDSRRGGTPFETLAAITPQLPRDLSCNAVVVLEDGRPPLWTTDPAPGPLARLDVEHLEIHQSSLDLLLDGAGTCPVCGTADAGGNVFVASAGAWSNGRALFFAGCTANSADGQRELVEEVAGACCVVLSERDRDWTVDLHMSDWLDGVIATEAFDIWFQPVVDMRTGRVVAQEALARFADGTAPNEVFSVASLIERRVPLELALVRRALSAARAIPPGITVNVNVSPLAAQSPCLAGLVDSADRPVVLEITEHALFRSESAKALRSSMPAGCRLAADDVGAGYAGLAQLVEFRPDIVKIDRSVVTGLDLDSARQALVAGLVQFSEATGCEVVAEGVERAAEQAMLLSLGVYHGQGFLFGRPSGMLEVKPRMMWTDEDGSNGRLSPPIDLIKT